MKKINDGGPAFPMARVTVLAEDGTPNEATGISHDGMTLRDYFAAKHMQALCSTKFYTDGNLMPKEVAQHSYEMADAMINEREMK